MPTKAKRWLGVAAVAASDKEASSRANLLATQLKALPLIGFALMQLQPEDSTVAMTMMEIMAAFARGISVRTVQETVDGILVPLMRAYGDAFTSFQKSASVPLPKLADVWAKERLEPSVMSFMSIVGTSEVMGGKAAPSASNSSDLKDLKELMVKRLDKLDATASSQGRKLNKLASDAGSEAGDESPKHNAPGSGKRSEKKRAKAAKAAEATAKAGAPAAAAP
jgi:hypothetical protein